MKVNLVLKSYYEDYKSLMFYEEFDKVITSTHSLCFRAKLRKKANPCKPQFYYIKSGVLGVYIYRTQDVKRR